LLVVLVFLVTLVAPSFLGKLIVTCLTIGAVVAISLVQVCVGPFVAIRMIELVVGWIVAITLIQLFGLTFLTEMFALA